MIWAQDPCSRGMILRLKLRISQFQGLSHIKCATLLKLCATVWHKVWHKIDEELSDFILQRSQTSKLPNILNFWTKMKFSVPKWKHQYQKGWILSKFISNFSQKGHKGLHLIFDFQEFSGDLCPKDITRYLYQIEIFCTKN